MKKNQYRSPFPLFSSFGGGGNLGHFRYVFLFLDTNKNHYMSKLLQFSYLGINFIDKSMRICNVLVIFYILISYFALRI